MVKAKEKGTLMKHFQTRSVLVVAIALLLAMIAAGTLYAAGEQMPRSTFASGGGTVTSGGATLRSVIGASLGGGVISSSSGLGLCSGFGCGTQIDSDGGGGGSSGKKIYLPAVQK